MTVQAVPGAHYRYSGGGFTVLQLLLEETSGKRFAELAETLVLGPLGMTHSTFAQPLPEAMVPRAASGHGADDEVIPGGFRVLPESSAGPGMEDRISRWRWRREE